MPSTLAPAEISRFKEAPLDELDIELFRHLHAVAILQRRLDISRLRIEVDASTGDTEIMASSREFGASYRHVAVVHSSGEMIAIAPIPLTDAASMDTDRSEAHL